MALAHTLENVAEAVQKLDKLESSRKVHMRLDMRQDWELLKAGNVGNVGNKVIMSFPPKNLPTIDVMLVMLVMLVI